MLYTFADAEAKDRHKTKYFEILGNRVIYHDGWLAHTVHRAAWEMTPRRPLLEDKLELYHVEEDFSSANDLAAKHPEKLKESQELFLKEATKNRTLPLDDRSIERANAALAGRPDLMAGRTSLTVYEGMIGMMENVFINVKNRPHAITAEVEIPDGGADGVILCQAGRFGGWSLYLSATFTHYPGTEHIRSGMIPHDDNRSFTIGADLDIPDGGAETGSGHFEVMRLFGTEAVPGPSVLGTPRIRG